MPDRRTKAETAFRGANLNRAAQVALSGSMLRMMNAGIASGEGDVESKRRRRNRFRKLLRDGALPDSRAAYHVLDLEKPKALAAQLGKVKSQVQAFALLVDLAAYQPWATLREPELLDKHARFDTLKRCAKHLPVKAGDVGAAASDLEPSRQWSVGRAVAVLGIGGAAAVLTAGVAAPAIGAAIGGTMGLSGAAATSAGLAAIGGGSLASGGFGMAGGTFILGVAGGAAGIGVGTLGTLPREDVATEIRKLRVLVNLCRQGNQASRTEARATVRECQRQLLAALDLISAARARAKIPSGVVANAEADARVLSQLDRELSFVPLPIDAARI